MAKTHNIDQHRERPKGRSLRDGEGAVGTAGESMVRPCHFSAISLFKKSQAW